EQHVPGLFEDAGDHRHALEEWWALRLDLAGRLRLRQADQELPVGLGEVREGQALDRQVLGHRQLAPGPDEARAPVGLALAEPDADLLDPGVRAKAGFELLTEQLGVLLETLLGGI